MATCRPMNVMPEIADMTHGPDTESQGLIVTSASTWHSTLKHNKPPKIDGHSSIGTTTLITPHLLNLISQLSKYTPGSTISTAALDALDTALLEEWHLATTRTLHLLETKYLVFYDCQRVGNAYEMDEMTKGLLESFRGIGGGFEADLLAGRREKWKEVLQRMSDMLVAIEHAFWKGHYRRYAVLPEGVGEEVERKRVMIVD